MVTERKWVSRVSTQQQQNLSALRAGMGITVCTPWLFTKLAEACTHTSDFIKKWRGKPKTNASRSPTRDKRQKCILWNGKLPRKTEELQYDTKSLTILHESRNVQLKRRKLLANQRETIGRYTTVEEHTLLQYYAAMKIILLRKMSESLTQSTGGGLVCINRGSGGREGG